jgi:hypothetical protein
MAAIPLTEFGLVPPGVHDCTLDVVAETFGRFQHSDRRPNLLERLRIFIKEVWEVDAEIQVLVNGSFVMGHVDEPGDIDVILILPATWDFSATLPPYKYNIVSKRMVRKLYRFDMLVGVAGQPSEAEAIRFFSELNVKWIVPLGIPAGTQKGLIRVMR